MSTSPTPAAPRRILTTTIASAATLLFGCGALLGCQSDSSETTDAPAEAETASPDTASPGATGGEDHPSGDHPGS